MCLEIMEINENVDWSQQDAAQEFSAIAHIIEEALIIAEQERE